MADGVEQHEYLTVREVAALLRVTERKVYDLASSGRVPCSKATGKLLFPEGPLRDWITAAQTGPAASGFASVDRPAVFLGSHDPLLEWAIRHSDSGLATFFDASLDGLRRFYAGEGIAAGLHLQEEDGTWNAATVAGALTDQNAVLVHWARRTRGFVVRKEHEDRLGDLDALSELTFAPRQSEAGSELLLRKVLNEAGLALDKIRFGTPCRSEQDAMMAVVQGEADVAFGLQALSAPFGLCFGSVVSESYDLVVDRKAWFEPPMQYLMAFAKSDRFDEHASKLVGFDISDLGKVIWNA